MKDFTHNHIRDVKKVQDEVGRAPTRGQHHFLHLNNSHRHLHLTQHGTCWKITITIRIFVTKIIINIFSGYLHDFVACQH